VPARLNAAGDTAVLQVFPTTSPQDRHTVQLIHHLRNDVLPQATAGTGVQVHVGGITAAFDDVSALLESRLPVFIGVVLLLSFLLLLVVFRSLLVPLKAVVMNLLSIGAAYGVLVAVFQKGVLASLFNVGKGPVESFLPMMLFAILFGLSMDYEIFLLSRIKEEYDRSGDNGSAVADGLSATARVITAAALIMVTVFGSFVFGDERVIKEFGLGLAVAIFVDATVVRMLLVPATMELLGDANWWLPKWLDRILPNVHIEGEKDLDHEIEELLGSSPESVVVEEGAPG
jgi:RND superfamily putative drug exporter